MIPDVPNLEQGRTLEIVAEKIGVSKGMRTDLISETSTKNLEEVGTLKRVAPLIGVSHAAHYERELAKQRKLSVLKKGNELPFPKILGNGEKL